jgi:Glycosyl transferase family 2
MAAPRLKRDDDRLETSLGGSNVEHRATDVEAFREEAFAGAHPLRPQAPATGILAGMPSAWSQLLGAFADHSRVAPRWISTARLESGNPEILSNALSYRRNVLRPGDVLMLDVPGRTSASADGVTRDALGRALFLAGFENTLLWAGRDVLVAEAHQASSLAALLPSSALGAGRRRAPDFAGALVPADDRIICLARRSALPGPAERPVKLSVVMPVYNEKSTFREVMDKLLAKRLDGVDIEICLVESNSTDGTRDDAIAYRNNSRVKLLLEERPLGKGHAVRAGLAMASGDIVLIQDADLEYDLDDYERLIDPIRQGEASFVLGSRHHAEERPYWKMRHFENAARMSDLLNFGHLFFTWLLNLVYFQRLRDPFTMYKVFRRDCIYALRFECNRFDFDVELVAKLIRNGYSPTEIDVAYKSRSFGDGKKVSLFRDPPTWIRACLKHRFSQLHDLTSALSATAALMRSQASGGRDDR